MARRTAETVPPRSLRSATDELYRGTRGRRAPLIGAPTRYAADSSTGVPLVVEACRTPLGTEAARGRISRWHGRLTSSHVFGFFPSPPDVVFCSWAFL